MGFSPPLFVPKSTQSDARRWWAEAHPTAGIFLIDRAVWADSGCGARRRCWGMPDYRRIWVPGGTYFFTVAIAERQRSLLTDHIHSLREAFRVARLARPFVIQAIVVLPDHLHCVWTLPPDDDAFPIRWSHIKAGFSRRIPAGEHKSDWRTAKRERGLWQRRYWEHLIRDERDLQRHVDYIHFNPVKHGYVKQASDWSYSSIHAWIARGDLPDDWSAVP